MAKSKSSKKKPLTDNELAKKYDTGKKIDFPKAIKKVAKAKK